MSWIFVALVGYSFLAFSSLSDKFLLSEKRIGAPALYAFFIGLTSLPFLALVPFGFVLFIPAAIATGVLSGFLFLYALLESYLAIKRSEVSRAAPLIGVTTVGFLFLLSMSSVVLSGKTVRLTDILALALLAGGAMLLATGGHGVSGPGFVRYVLISGILFALALVALKESYYFSDFATGFVWSKLGIVLAGASLFLFPSFRKDILSGHDRFEKPVKQKLWTAVFFFLNQVFGGLGTLAVSYSVSLGPATFVQGMEGVRYGLVFLLAMVLSTRFPAIFREHISHRETIRKLFAIVFLALGVWLVSTGTGLESFL